MKRVLSFVLGFLVLLNLFLIGLIVLDKYDIVPLEKVIANSTVDMLEEPINKPIIEETIKEDLEKPLESEENAVEIIEEAKEDFVESVEVEEIIKENGEVTISLVGDMLMDGSVRAQINQNGYHYPWEYVRDYFQDGDITIGNLETSITRGGTVWPDKQFNFRSDPENLEAMKKAGIDVVSLANNHSLDYGYDGLLDTLNHIDKSGIFRVGAGKDRGDAFKETIIEKNGHKIGILGFSRVVPDVGWWATKSRPGLAGAYDPQLPEALEKIKEVKEKVDILIVSIHWGTELQTYPRDIDVVAAKKIVDAGADVIMGHHPHVLQGVEVYKGKPIFYSLGNFVFGVKSELTSSTMIAQVNIINGRVDSLKIIPHKIVGGRPTPYSEEEKLRKIEYINELSNEWGIKFNSDGVSIVN